METPIRRSLCLIVVYISNPKNNACADSVDRLLVGTAPHNSDTLQHTRRTECKKALFPNEIWSGLRSPVESNKSQCILDTIDFTAVPFGKRIGEESALYKQKEALVNYRRQMDTWYVLVRSGASLLFSGHHPRLQ